MWTKQVLTLHTSRSTPGVTAHGEDGPRPRAEFCHEASPMRNEKPTQVQAGWEQSGVHDILAMRSVAVYWWCPLLTIRSNTRSSFGKEFHRVHLSARCVLRPTHERCPTGRVCNPATMTCIIACSLSALILPRSLRIWKVRYSWRGD